MKRAGSGLHARAGIVAALVAALVLAACLEAYVTHPSSPHVHHDQWIKIERAAAIDVALPIALVGLPSTDLVRQQVPGEFVLARTCNTPRQPYRSAPASARAPPAPLGSVV